VAAKALAAAEGKEFSVPTAGPTGIAAVNGLEVAVFDAKPSGGCMKSISPVSA